ncbi:MAG: hypothetical protein GC178_11065 [Flavobacteriales bacterium]|nr:hypothetical protein [Flavobacteriales bacterium]
MTKLWERAVEFSDPKSQISVGGVSWSYMGSTSAFQISNEGNIMCWATNEREEFALYNISADKTIRVEVPNVRKGNWDFETNNGSMVMVGTYTEDEIGAAGLLVVNWNGKEGSEPIVNKVPITVEHLLTNQTDKEVEKLKKKVSKGKSLEIRYFHLKTVKLLDDNSLVVIGQKSYSSDSGFEYQFDYHVFHISPQNELLFDTQIPYSAGGGGFDIGYRTKFIGNTMYLFFNDRIENLTADWSKNVPEKYTGPENVVSLVKMDFSNPELNPKRYPLWNFRDVDGKFEPRKYTSPNGSDFGYFYIQGGRLTQRLIKIKFK